MALVTKMPPGRRQACWGQQFDRSSSGSTPRPRWRASARATGTRFPSPSAGLGDAYAVLLDGGPADALVRPREQDRVPVGDINPPSHTSGRQAAAGVDVGRDRRCPTTRTSTVTGAVGAARRPRAAAWEPGGDRGRTARAGSSTSYRVGACGWILCSASWSWALTLVDPQLVVCLQGHAPGGEAVARERVGGFGACSSTSTPTRCSVPARPATLVSLSLLDPVVRRSMSCSVAHVQELVRYVERQRQRHAAGDGAGAATGESPKARRLGLPGR